MDRHVSTFSFKVLLVLVFGAFAATLSSFVETPQRGWGSAMPVFIASPFIYSFNSPGVLNEAGSMAESSSPYWWLNSGGEFRIEDGVGKTMQGEASTLNRWRLLYALSNPVDSDNGLHPQNLFRLVTRSEWNNMRIEAKFKIRKDNWSTSPNRNASNGLLFMSRYTSGGETLYYAGIRVDGNAVIKKKYRGTYYTLATKKIFAGDYVQGSRVNVLPHQSWIGLRSETRTRTDGTVLITLYMQGQDGSWKRILEALDDGGVAVNKTPPITSAGYAGLRTDFMDVEFSGIRIENL